MFLFKHGFQHHYYFFKLFNYNEYYWTSIKLFHAFTLIITGISIYFRYFFRFKTFCENGVFCRVLRPMDPRLERVEADYQTMVSWVVFLWDPNLESARFAKKGIGFRYGHDTRCCPQLSTVIIPLTIVVSSYSLIATLNIHKYPDMVCHDTSMFWWDELA